MTATKRRWFRFSLAACLALLAVLAAIAFVWPRQPLSPIDTMIFNRSERESLYGATQSEVEQRLGAPDIVNEGSSEWYYRQEDVSHLWPMSLSKVLYLRFENDKLVHADSRD
jgi:hypothetical protein